MGDEVAPDAAGTTVRVEHEAERKQFTIAVDGRRAGLAAYRDREGVRIFHHTEVDDAYEGRGLGGRLVGAALDATRDDGLRIVPLCPFVASYVERHPEYDSLVDRDLWAALERRR